MRLEGSKGGKRNAKRLRQEMTSPEIGLWLALRTNDAGLRFRKQHSAGGYVLDFYCARPGWRLKSMAKRTSGATDRNGMRGAIPG